MSLRGLTGRLSSFLVGAGAGAAFYYYADSRMMWDMGKARTRAGELREELVGIVSLPAKSVKNTFTNNVLAPFTTSDATGAWNSAVLAAYKTVSSGADMVSNQIHNLFPKK